MESCSGRFVSIGSSGMGLSSDSNDFTELRSIFRRWLKLVFTTVLNNFSLQLSCFRLLRVRRTTADLTLGGGINACSSTVNRYSTSYHACRSTLRIPYVLLPGEATIRCATSFCIIPVQQGTDSLLSSTLKKIWEEML